MKAMFQTIGVVLGVIGAIGAIAWGIMAALHSNDVVHTTPDGAASWHRIDMGSGQQDVYWTACPGGRLYGTDARGGLCFVPITGEAK